MDRSNAGGNYWEGGNNLVLCLQISVKILECTVEHSEAQQVVRVRTCGASLRASKSNGVHARSNPAFRWIECDPLPHTTDHENGLTNQLTTDHALHNQNF